MSGGRLTTLAIAGALLVAGCEDNAPQPTLINGCDHPVEVAASAYFGLDPDDDPMTVRDYTSTKVIGPGETYAAPVANFTAGSVEGIVFGQDEAMWWEWGVDVTGSSEFTISGALCLEPSTVAPGS